MDNKEITQAVVETTPTEAPAVPTIEELQKQISELQSEKDKLKKAMDAACSDAAKFKKDANNWQEQFKSTLDEQKRKEFESEEAHKQLLAQLSEYKTKERIATYKSKLMTAGFDEATASTMSTALPDGVEDSFFEAQKMFLDFQKQNIKTQTLNSQPSLSVGIPPTAQSDPEADNLRRWMGLPSKK